MDGAGTVVETAKDGIKYTSDTISGKRIKADQDELVSTLKSHIDSIQTPRAVKPHTYHVAMATKLYDSMQAWQPSSFTISSETFNELEKLNADDLLAIYKVFGIRKNTAFAVIDQGRGDLIMWLKNELEDSWFGDFSRMGKIWAKTKKW